MSAVACTIGALMRDAAVTAIVKDRIVNMVSSDQSPNILVNLIYEGTDEMLGDPSRWYFSRVSVECRSSTLPEVQVLGEAVKDALEPLHLETINGCECSFRKDGSDVTSFADEASVGVRIIDFACDWRRV